MNKKQARQRRGLKTRINIKNQQINRLTVHKTSQHIYAQIISPCGTQVIAASSTLRDNIKSQIKNGGNVDAASIVGKDIAERAVAAGVKSVAFDRSGFRYHGRIKALADAARENGLEF